MHLDVRSDNILIEPTGRIVFVDWTHACIGASWLDLVLMIPVVGRSREVAMPSDLLDGPRGRCRPATRSTPSSLRLPASSWSEGRMPDPPGLPTVRAFQRAQGEVTLRWLRTRLGDPVPQ